MKLRNSAISTFQRYRGTLERTRLRTDTEGLHRLRVRMKKARSLLRFLRHLDSDVPLPKGARRRSNELFRAAGALREVQMNCERLKELRTIPAKARLIGTSHLRKKDDRLAKELRRSLDRIRPEDFQRWELYVLRVLQGRTMNELRAAAQGFARAELDRAMRLTQAADAHLHLHEVRKHLKHVRHLHELLDIGVPEPTGLGKVLERLGTWHDLLVLRTSLQELRKLTEQRNTLLAAIDQRLLTLRTDSVHRLQLLFGERYHSPRTKSQRTPFHMPTKT